MRAIQADLQRSRAVVLAKDIHIVEQVPMWTQKRSSQSLQFSAVHSVPGWEMSERARVKNASCCYRMQRWSVGEDGDATIYCVGRLVAGRLGGHGLLGFRGAASAQQAYPSCTVKFIMPFGAASASDITARLFADRLSARSGKPVVVENRPGGDGIVSVEAFVNAADDHTLWFGPAGILTARLTITTRCLRCQTRSATDLSVSAVVLAISAPHR